MKESINTKFSPWHYKPWWCQPWSILLTGTVLMTGSWLTARAIWLTLLVSLPILLWWAYFLLIWPHLIKSSILKNQNYSEKSP